VVYAIGHGIDGWADVIAESTGTPVVVVDKDIELLPFDAPTEDQDADRHEQEETAALPDGVAADPHYWLSPRNAVHMTRTIAADRATRRPDHSSTVAANADRYVHALAQTDAQIHGLLESVPNKNLVTLHDAWGYFAAEYGLRITGSFEPAPGKEPTPAWISALGKAVTAAKVRAVYAEPQLSSQGLEAFAKDHGLKIISIDPEGSESADSYIDMLRHNAQAIHDNQ
jgi:ABC-type Zn uptake system ZnuABC Zn-binding protein ZnuA